MTHSFLRPLPAVAGLAALALLAPAGAQARQSAPGTEPIPEIAYEKFVLDNGLTLIVHEDHKAPIVAVNIWYHVGSKNEKPGKTGFAHLFEHLMFNGSEHFNDDYFQVLERIGATDLNGTTSNDRTNYFQNVPTSALDAVLWMESDRMGHMIGAIDQAKLDEQRGVVQNEKRQGENQPYGRVFNLIAESAYPDDHPYSWPVIGSMEDLNAASLEDVHEWFRTYYGPNNAVIVLAGDIDPETAKAKVEQYFGAIPPGPPIEKPDVWIAKMTGEHREIMQDRVPQARIYKVWNIPEWGSADGDYLALAADVLASGKTSRLYKRLVYDEQIATDVSAFPWLKEIGGQFILSATARPGGDLAEVERVLDEELDRFLAEGPTPEELERVQTQARASFIRGIERIGGFGGKSDVLAESEVFGGSPDAYRVTQQRIQAATTRDVHDAARRWLSDGVLVVEVHPFPQLAAKGSDVDRSAVPEAGAPPAPEFPRIQRAELSNGLDIVLAERHTLPLVNFTLILDAGYAADQHGTPGTASLAMNMLDEGTETRSALEISEELARLGAFIGTGSDLDASYVTLSALKEKLDPSLELFADVVLNPSFPQADFERLRKQQLARIQREKTSPLQMALRVFPPLIFGKDHAYGIPFTGSGTEASVQSLSREDLAEFHDTWFKPNHATLVVVGDITLGDLRPKLERLFRDWDAGDIPEKNIARVEQPAPAVYLIDRPGSIQSVIFAGHLFPPKANPDEIAIETMNNILGGSFTSRINMNLREDKHWSYGASSIVIDARGQRPFFAYAPVQTDKTAESIAELRKELNGLLGARPATAEELAKAKDNQTLTLAGRWETIGAIGNSIEEVVRYGLDDDYWRTYADRVRALDLDDITGAARATLHPDHLVWVVVGDRSKIEEPVRALGLGEIHFIDADGNPVGVSEVSEAAGAGERVGALQE
ncbi:MAG TPA: pitrilysin family protein [Longimicrobiales bacterium]